MYTYPPLKRGSTVEENNCSNEQQISSFITKTRLFKYIEDFTTTKWKFSDKNSDIFHISA